jgi:probable phosphoglycerate mutase
MIPPNVPILLVRHGQSEWNAARRWQGLADSPLTELGRGQAATCAEVLRSLDHRWPAVRSSPLRRAASTGEIIAARLGLAPIEVDERLREADAGEWQGMTPDEIEQAYPGFLADHRRPPTFETFDSVVHRVVAALGDIASAADPADGALIVTTHSGVIRSIVRRLGVHDERVPNLGGVWIRVAGRSVIDASPGTGLGIDHGIDLGDRFDPAGVVRTGVDAPGEDPGDEADQPDAHCGSER